MQIAYDATLYSCDANSTNTLIQSQLKTGWAKAVHVLMAQSTPGACDIQVGSVDTDDHEVGPTPAHKFILKNAPL